MIDLAPKLTEPINDLRERAQRLEPHLDRDLLRTNILNIRRLCEQMLHIIQTETLDELRSERPMPEHKFFGNTQSPRIATIDDL